MTDAEIYLMFSRIILMSLMLIIILVKLILYYRFERDWNLVTFFYFNKIQLKLTISRHLRQYRITQNFLSLGVIITLILFLFSTLIKVLIIS